MQKRRELLSLPPQTISPVTSFPCHIFPALARVIPSFIPPTSTFELFGFHLFSYHYLDDYLDRIAKAYTQAQEPGWLSVDASQSRESGVAFLAHSLGAGFAVLFPTRTQYPLWHSAF